ncbi:zinc ribbon domain-containing protein [Thermogymnomonas acidicola]|nr:zinc ribbon domain-containing protein [Thermogymnomonas acidicola]
MPIYEVGEHEILREEAEVVDGETVVAQGTLYLTDRRIIYERRGRRGLIRAVPPKIILDVYLYDISNVSIAVPRLKLFTRKEMEIEYRKDGQKNKIVFRLSDPQRWDTEIRKWINDAKIKKEEEMKREEEERHRREVELAKARAPRANIGMAYFGKGPAQGQEQKPQDANVYDAEVRDIEEPKRLGEEKRLPQKCPRCGSDLPAGAKFCPNCGQEL